jgi:serpin B
MSNTLKFASKLYPQLGTLKENSFYSGFSVQLALGMCQAGAKGETKKSLDALLEISEDSEYKALVNEVNSSSERPYELTTANALWCQDGFPLDESYKSRVASIYGGGVNSVDYVNAPDAAVDSVNGWCNEHTRGKIPTIITRDFVNPETRLILTNAIYFKGKWKTEFDKKRTKDDVFYSPDGEKNVPTMHITSEYFYGEGSNFKALDLPYKGEKLSMLVVLPDRGLDTLPDLETTYNNAVNSLCYEDKVVVSLPKFKLETEYKMGDTLKKMGAELAFSDFADFSGITSADALKISEVIHKAFVQVDEEGTEAAAATAVGMMRCTSVRMPKQCIFNADHPFVFFIRNNETNTVLFSGRVTNP